MAHPRPFLLPALACSALLMTGGLNRQATPSAPPPLPAGIDPLDPSGTPGGTELLDASAAAYGRARVPWMEMTLWQRVTYDDFAYEVHGRYLAAPDHCLRLDLKVRVGETDGALQLISNGRALRSSYRFDEDAPSVTRTVSLTPSAGPSGTAPAAPPVSTSAADREQILRESGCPAVAPLLRTIRARLQEPRRKSGRWKGHDVIQVMGRWSPDPAAVAGLPSGLWPNLQTRECRVYLDSRTLWPLRIEWWGSASPQKRNVLLVQVEYRDPVLNQPMPMDRYVREFAITADEVAKR